MPTRKVVDFPHVFTQDHLSEAKKLAARVLIGIQKHYNVEDGVMIFRSPGQTPEHATLILLRQVLTEEMGYEDVEWFVHETFLWDIIVLRKNIPLL